MNRKTVTAKRRSVKHQAFVPGSMAVAIRPDSWVLIPALVLLCTGIVMVGSASIAIAESQGAAPYHYLARHLVFVLLGVILASSLIPGNENAVYRVINGLIDLGANVVHKGNAKVHVSGHAAAGELLYAYNLVKPTHVMPIHGEARHLRANAQVAIDSGVPHTNALVGENGTVVDVTDGYARITGQLDIGYVYVDGSTVGEITEADLKDRRILAEEGFISIFLAIDAQTGKIIVGPEIHARGFAPDDSVFDDVRPDIVKALEEAAANGTRDTHQFSQVVRRTVGRWVNTRHRRRPMIVPIVIEA